MSETTAPDDIRSQILGAMEGPDTPEPAKVEPEDPTRSRGPDGKFAKAEPEVTEPEPEPEPEVAETPETAEPEKPEEPKTAEAPANWPADAKEAFKELTPKAQAFMLDRSKQMEADYTRKTQAIATFRKDYEPVAQMFAPHADVMRAKGFTPETLIKSWYGVEKALVDGKGVDIIEGIVKAYPNIDKAALARRLGFAAATGAEALPEPQGQQFALPPEVQARLDAHDQFIAQQQWREQNAQIEARRSQESRVMSEIEKFSTEVDATGKPLRPYFAEVEDDMTVLANALRMQTGSVPPLAELYDRAVGMNPTTRAKIEADRIAAHVAQRTAAEKKTREAARAKSDQAKRAASPVIGAPGTGQAAMRNGERTLRDQLLEAADDASAA